VRFVVHLAEVAGATPCRVIARLQDGTWRVIVGDGVGQLDGGSHQDWAEDDLPLSIRRPNAPFWVTLAE